MSRTIDIPNLRKLCADAIPAALDELEVLRVKNFVGAGPWLPIDTAPRDGTPFLGLIREIDSPENQARIEMMFWQKYAKAKVKREGWRIKHLPYYAYNDEYEAVTHWSPLPAPLIERQ